MRRVHACLPGPGASSVTNGSDAALARRATSLASVPSALLSAASRAFNSSGQCLLPPLPAKTPRSATGPVCEFPSLSISIPVQSLEMESSIWGCPEGMGLTTALTVRLHAGLVHENNAFPVDPPLMAHPDLTAALHVGAAALVGDAGHLLVAEPAASRELPDRVFADRKVEAFVHAARQLPDRDFGEVPHLVPDPAFVRGEDGRKVAAVAPLTATLSPHSARAGRDWKLSPFCRQALQIAGL